MESLSMSKINMIKGMCKNNKEEEEEEENNKDIKKVIQTPR